MYGQEEETVYKDVYRGFTAHPSSTLHVCEWVRRVGSDDGLPSDHGGGGMVQRPMGRVL